ncbi:MAG: hypothetical protein ACKVT0_12980 [Planctomycetaceae bacterium]
MRNLPAISRLIPLTSLRHFYRLLRQFGSQAFHLQAAKECNRRTVLLDNCVSRSYKHFALYDNRHEGFHDRDPAGNLTDARNTNTQMANRFVQMLVNGEQGFSIADPSQLDYSFVDYEISPLRTTRAEYENGTSGQDSGCGGVDLLLCNCLDGTPIVGEIKADTDVNPFFGLIQGLMYAVELATEPQRARMKTFYPDKVSWGTAGPWIDIYLFLLNYPQDETSQCFLNLTRKISDRLLQDNSRTSKIVRRIVALHHPMSPENDNGFTVEFAFGPMGEFEP